MAPDYTAGSLRFHNVGGGMSLPLRIPIWNTVSLFGFYKVVERMRIDQVVAFLFFYCLTEIDWSSSEVLDDFVYYDFFHRYCTTLSS